MPSRVETPGLCRNTLSTARTACRHRRTASAAVRYLFAYCPSSSRICSATSQNASQHRVSEVRPFPRGWAAEAPARIAPGGTHTTPTHTSQRAASWASISGDGCVHGRSWGTGTPKAPVEDEALILGPAPIGAPHTCAAAGYTCHSYTLAHQGPGKYAASPAQGGYRARDPSSAPRREPVTNSL